MNLGRVRMLSKLKSIGFTITAFLMAEVCQAGCSPCPGCTPSGPASGHTEIEIFNVPTSMTLLQCCEDTPVIMTAQQIVQNLNITASDTDMYPKGSWAQNSVTCK